MREFAEVLTPIRDPVELVPEHSYREIGIRSHGKGIFHKESVTGKSLGSKRVFRVEPDCLTFNIVFAWEGAVARTSTAEMGFIASHRFPMHKPSEHCADLDYLLRFFQSRRGVRLLGDASPGGAGRNRTLNQAELAKIPLPLPPLPEQRKIAAILSSVDEAIEKTQAVIDQVQVAKKGLMQELLTRGLPGRHTRFKQTEIGEVPEGWEVLPILDACELPSGQVDPLEQPYKDWPLVAPNHIESGTGRLLALETAREQRAKSGKYPFRAGDVVYSKIRPYLQKAWLANVDGICSADMYPLRAKRGVAPSYLLLELLGPRFTDYAASVSMRTGIPKINRKELAEYKLALPSLDEQREIGAVCGAIDERLRKEGAALDAGLLLKNALMSVLLTGEVRVKVDEEQAA